MRTRWMIASFAVACVGLSLGACKKPPAAGSACTKEWATECTGKAAAVVCVSGKWETLACRDITGCMDMGDGNDNCSNDKQNAGEPCKNEGSYSCSVDAKAIMKCDSKHWTKVDDCNGQNGCQSNAQGARCDKGTETVGASCSASNEGNFSCTPDAKSLLVCKNGKMVVAATCKGMNGCRQMGQKLDCNETIADVNDPCEGYEGKYACDTDKKTRLVCKGGKFLKDKTCKSCSVLIEEIQCQ